jgi:hypothetical protein
MKKNTFIPPYTSAGDFVKFINSVRVRRPDPLTVQALEQIDIGRSNAYTLFGALKSMELYDEKGTLLQRDDLSGLASKDEDIKRASFRKILERTYEDLIAKIPINDATVEKVRYYFVVNGAAPSIAIKAARLFIWLANQAGFETAETEFTPYNMEQEKTKKKKEIKKTPSTNGATRRSSSQPAPSYVASPADYEERLLNILLEKISSTNELPSADILKQVRELIELQKGKSKNQQTSQDMLPLMGNENENA